MRVRVRDLVSGVYDGWRVELVYSWLGSNSGHMRQIKGCVPVEGDRYDLTVRLSETNWKVMRLSHDDEVEIVEAD